MPRPIASEAMRRAKFLAAVDDSGGPDACWPWTQFRLERGYGKVNWRLANGRKRPLLTHRVAYVVARNTPIEAIDGVIIRHTCDNPPCCNPAHLVAGTSADNTGDMVMRQRGMHGERCVTAKLSSDQVCALINRARAGERQIALAREFDISTAQASRIINGTRWRHLKDSPNGKLERLPVRRREGGA